MVEGGSALGRVLVFTGIVFAKANRQRTPKPTCTNPHSLLTGREPAGPLRATPYSTRIAAGRQYSEYFCFTTSYSCTCSFYAFPSPAHLNPSSNTWYLYIHTNERREAITIL